MEVARSYDCLLNCLKEVHLDRFHRNFVQHGVTNCSQLCCLPAEQYAKFGVSTTEDRRNLLSIIEVIRSLQAGGVRCQHGKQPQNSDQMKDRNNSATRQDQVSKAAAILIENLKPLRQCGDVSQAATRKSSSDLAKGDDSHGNQFIKPINMSKNFKVTFERSAEEELKQRQLIKSGFAAKKQSDSPVFQCRKTLNFSDPDLYSDDEPTTSRNAFKTPLPSEPFQSNHVVSNSTNVPQGEGRSKPPSEENVTAKDAYRVLSANGVVKPNCEDSVGNREAFTNANGVTSGGKLVRHAISNGSVVADDREHSSSNALFREKEKGDGATLATAFASTLMFNSKPVIEQSLRGITKETIAPSQKFSVNLDDKESTLHLQHAMNGFWNGAKHLQKNALNRNHAYFPSSESNEEAPKPVHVEQIFHCGGYNYGVPTDGGRLPGLSPESGDNGSNKSLRNVLHPERIKVCVRKRPRNAKELKRNEKDIIRVHAPQTIVVQELKVAVDLTKFIHQHSMMFDEVFDDKCSNKEVYDRAVKPLVSCLFEKGSAICFAFGQTGAGKTHTLMGNRSTPGLYQLAAADLFTMANAGRYRQPLRLWVSFYEIYCGHVYDLLNKRNRLHVRESGKQKVCVAGLMENPVHDVDNLTQVINYGNSFRSRGTTGVNPHSSRSHAIIEIQVRDFRDNRVGRLKFIDLAGSERASDAINIDRQTRIEGAEINQSLLALKECIRSIDQESSHTPYRQSKLTLILRDSFLGNAQSVMIANIAPTQTACENTMNTLRYADRVQELRKEVAMRMKRPTSPSAETKNVLLNKSPTKNNSVGDRRSAPSLFHPADIQFSSTPMKGSAAAAVEPINLSEIVLDGHESPTKSVDGRKSFADMKKPPSPLNISPIKDVIHHGGVGGANGSDVKQKRNETGGDDDGDGVVLSGNVARDSLESRTRDEHSKRCCSGQNCVETDLPCFCKTQNEVVARKSNDFDDDLILEQQKVKSLAERVMLKVKSVIDRNADPVQHSKVDDTNDEIHEAQAVFLETKVRMENARENIRDWLDNEKKSRASLNSGQSVSQKDSMNSIQGTFEGRQHPDQFHSRVIRLNSNVFSGEDFASDSMQLGNRNFLVNDKAGRIVDRKIHLSDHDDPVSKPEGLVDANRRGSERCLTNSTSNLKDVKFQEMVSKQSNGRDGVHLTRENGFNVEASNMAKLDNISVVVQDEEEEEEAEEGSSFVASQEIRLLKLKIEELKLQRELLERQQQIYAENQSGNFERFKEFSINYINNANISQTSEEFAERQRSTSDSVTTNGNDKVIGNINRNSVEPDDMSKVLDHNENISKCFRHGTDESFPHSSVVANTNHNCRSNDADHESVDGLVDNETDGSVDIGIDGCNTVLRRQTNNSVRRDNVNEFSSQDTPVLQTEVRSLHDIQCEFKEPIHMNDQQRWQTTPENSYDQARCLKRPDSSENVDLEQSDGSYTTLALHRNAAISKVVPSVDEFRNKSCQLKAANTTDEKPFKETESKELAGEVSTSDLQNQNIPSSVLSVGALKPVDSYPVTHSSSADVLPESGSRTARNANSDPSLDQTDIEASQCASPLDRTRSLLVAAHEDQLTAVTQLCKREMLLLMAVRTGQMNYSQYMENIRDILCKKSKIILALVEHINEFHSPPEH